MYMNIKQAKEYIKNTVKIYLKKDEFGEYSIPAAHQRPVFLLGAPGIGKTALMEQIAQEMGIALVSYSMTHHTRQSALGLPFISQKNYGGTLYSVSEYTMSEIIASVYDTMESGGIKEGILFLDEINCVSETLAPAMLQFLQYKTFGRHRIPEGWVVVTAGNPPEYNRSVREFDVATLDRLKVMEVEPDYTVWKEYASEKRIHNAIISYLDLKKEDFYRIETTARGRSYVTARGWEDLSEILILYEEDRLPADRALVGQYLRNDRVAEEFSAYYELYRKYKKDYNIADILEGRPGNAAAKAGAAAFDERLSLLGMLSDAVQARMKDVMEQAAYLTDLRSLLKGMESLTKQEGCTGTRILARLRELSLERGKLLDRLRAANSLSETEKRKHKNVIGFLEEGSRELQARGFTEGEAAYGFLKECFQAKAAGMKIETEKTQDRIHALFSFVQEAFGQGNELLILLTELTKNSVSARFIAAFGCPDYAELSSGMMLTQRRDSIQERIAVLEL